MVRIPEMRSDLARDSTGSSVIIGDGSTAEVQQLHMGYSSSRG